MRRHLALLIATGVITGACASTGISGAHRQYGLDFAAYRTYDWGPADALPVTDVRFDANPVFTDHVFGSVDTILQARGLARSTDGQPDLLIHYHASITERMELEPAGDGVNRSVRHFEAGTLVIDMVDARTRRVIWRGWVQQRAQILLERPERVDAAVAEVLARLPVGTPEQQTGGR